MRRIVYEHGDPHDDRNTKVCRSCRNTKSVACFPWCKKECRYLARCYECRRDYARQYYRLRNNCPSGGRPIKWTPERIELLRQCILAGDSIPEAAAKLKITPAAVATYRCNNHLPKFRRTSIPARRRAWSAERVARLKQLRDAGDTFEVCAAVLGTTRGAIASAVSVYINQPQESREK